VSPAALLALGMAFFTATSGLIVKTLSRRDTPLTITLYMAVLTTPISLIPALFVWTTPSPDAWLWCLFLGAAASGVQFCLANALSLAEYSAVLPFDFSKLIFSALAGILVFSETPDIWTWIGAAVIFSSTLYSARREAKAAGGTGKGVTRPPPDP
jgi:drug/metabolite transporter (DMT)-like permease